MLTNEKICEKIEDLFPDKGKCGKDMKVVFSKDHKAYILKYKCGSVEKKTFLEVDDASLCIEKERCLGLGFQVNQPR